MMENENPNLPEVPEMDIYEREEQCSRALKQVAKACVMRVVVTGLLLFVLLCEQRALWFWGLLGLVMLLNLAGLLPLLGEVKRRLQELKQLRSMED